MDSVPDDTYGIGQLYYSDDGWTQRIASQVKALLAGGKASKVPDPAGLAGFHLFRQHSGAGSKRYFVF